jgi:hypothetical protein
MSRNPLRTSNLRLRYVVIIPVIDTYLKCTRFPVHRKLSCVPTELYWLRILSAWKGDLAARLLKD